MLRIQLHLSEDQDRRLRAAARRERTTRAALIRRAVDAFLDQAQEVGGDSLLSLVGIVPGTGATDDAGERHDHYLAEREVSQWARRSDLAHPRAGEPSPRIDLPPARPVKKKARRTKAR